MIAVPNKVDLADLIEFDRRQATCFHPLLDTGPTLAQFPLAGKKGASEILVTAHAAHDRIQGDILQTSEMLVVQAQTLLHRVERQEVQ